MWKGNWVLDVWTEMHMPSLARKLAACMEAAPMLIAPPRISSNLCFCLCSGIVLVTFLISAKSKVLLSSFLCFWNGKLALQSALCVTWYSNWPSVLYLELLKSFLKNGVYLSACIYCCHRKSASLILAHPPRSLNLSLGGSASWLHDFWIAPRAPAATDNTTAS